MRTHRKAILNELETVALQRNPVTPDTGSNPRDGENKPLLPEPQQPNRETLGF